MGQTTFEAQVAMVQDKLEPTFLDRYDHLHSVVEAISDRMNVVEKDFSQSRESYISDMEEKSQAVDNDLINFKKAFEEELRTRAEREGQLHKKITMLEAKTSEKFEHERQICDHKFARMREDIDGNKRLREGARLQFEASAAAEIAAQKTAVESEAIIREQADDDIVNALNHYTKALQEAMRAVSKQTIRAFSPKPYSPGRAIN